MRLARFGRLFSGNETSKILKFFTHGLNLYSFNADHISRLLQKRAASRLCLDRFSQKLQFSGQRPDTTPASNAVLQRSQFRCRRGVLTSRRANDHIILNLEGYWVCVVVVELAGTAGVVVVVVLVVVVGAGVEQPVNDTRATAAKQERMIFFIKIIVVWFVASLYEHETTPAVGPRLWGVTLPYGRCQIPRLREKLSANFTDLRWFDFYRQDARGSATDEHRFSQMFLSAFHLRPSVAPASLLACLAPWR